MAGNRGQSSLKRRRRTSNPMAEYDALPPELRAWLSQAILPWGVVSARKAYRKALAKTGDHLGALRELDAMQSRLIARDARQIWGEEHPEARLV